MYCVFLYPYDFFFVPSLIYNFNFFGSWFAHERNLCSAAVGWSNLLMPVMPSWLVVYRSSFPYKFSTCSSVYREKSVQVSSFNCDCVNVFFNFYHLLLHVFWSTLIRYIHIYNCYVFLIKLPLYRCRVSLYLLIFLVLKPTLSGNKIDTLPFFWLIFTWHIFFHPFIFPLCIFVFKIGFCIQHIVGSCIFFLQY